MSRALHDRYLLGYRPTRLSGTFRRIDVRLVQPKEDTKILLFWTPWIQDALTKARLRVRLELFYTNAPERAGRRRCGCSEQRPLPARRCYLKPDIRVWTGFRLLSQAVVAPFQMHIGLA